jgi:type IV pilus assembly protein PilE
MRHDVVGKKPIDLGIPPLDERTIMVPASRGFTLIELMIAVAIVAILATVAYPSYQEYVRRSNRSAAQSVMLDVAARQHQYLLDTRGYANSLGTPIATVLEAGPPPGFRVTATPVGSQAADRCGNLAVDRAGQKTADAANCW